MTKTKKIYSKTTNEQQNPNQSTTYNKWTSMQNAVGDTSTVATGKYTRKTKTVNKKKVSYEINPQTVAVADFRITTDDIPTNAYINSVTIYVGLSCDKSLSVKAPVGSFMIYNGKGKVTQHSKDGTTGWYNNTYRVYPSTKLTTSNKDIAYTIPGSEWNKMAYPTGQLHKPAFGIDLKFQDITKMTGNSANVYLKHAYVVVDYEIPNYVLTYSRATSKSTPHVCGVTDTVCVNATLKNTTKADGGNQTVKITLPPETELISNSQPMTKISDGVYSWVCSGKGLASTTNKLCLKLKSFGLKTLSSKLGNKDYPYYIDPRPSEDILIQHGDIKANEESCWQFNIRTDTSANTVTYYVDVDGQNKLDYSKLSQVVQDTYCITENNDNLLVNWELDPSCAAQGISIIDYTNNSVTFELIDNDGNHIDNAIIRWKGCFIPLLEGENTLVATRQDEGVVHQYTDDYIALDSDNTEIAFQVDPIIWYDHRLLFEVDALGHILPIAVNPFDRVMVEGDCTLKAHIWDEVAYIGCVPVQRSHYEPDSDYTNDLLRETYKNKTYMGKKGEIDEDISLKIKLPPRDWTTLQGLTKLDKPVPVNLVPKAFEGDVLNHRGWVELYGVKGVSKTNPLYYDGELQVSYLTHNINTRFTIEKGTESTATDIPPMTINVLESGEEFATYTYLDEDGEIVTNSGYFDVDTDGVYVYDRYSEAEEGEEPEEIDENLRTIITMDNKQHINIKSNQTLPEQADIHLTWNSTKIDENRENNIERIIYITDDSGKPIFKYQYYNYEFDTDAEYFTCMVKASRLLADDSWEDIIDKELLLSVDVESLQLKTVYNEETGKYELVQEDEEDVFIDDDEDEDADDGEIFAYNDYVYGSSVRFVINGTRLSVTDEGYNGKSISFSTELLPKKYYYDLQFQNLNTDGDTFDVLSFFNFEVAESMIASDYANDYKGMYISSFPIPHKQVLFTRQCNEGTIYYFRDDGSNNFAYIQDPFYMYFCGVDIENQVGSSLFSLDNSYTTFYLDNGLVRLGFNRLNGDLYLSKYDILSDSYINVAELQTTNHDYSIGTFSDDKIEIVAGTTVYTMYRGHPYVIIKHPNEDLKFGTKWTNIWAEKVNGEAEDFPIFWDLLNHQNMLPACVGRGDINSNCLEIDNYENPGVTTKPTLSLSEPSSTIYNNQISIWTLTGSDDIISEGIIILIDGEVSEVIPVLNDVPQTNENDEYIKTDLVTTPKFGIIFPDNKEHSVRAVYCGSGNKGIAFTDKITVIPKQWVDTTPPAQGEPDGAYNLEIINLPTSYTYMSMPNWSWRLTKGGVPVKGKLIQRDLPHGGVWTGTTDSKGIVTLNKDNINLNNASTLNSFRKWSVGKHTVRARFHQYDDSSLPLLTSVSRNITISKGTPKMTFTGAGKKGKKAKFKLQDPQGYNLAKKKIVIQHGGKRYTKTTNDNGNAYLLINKSGYKTYKVTYAGDSNLKKKTWTFHETVAKK